MEIIIQLYIYYTALLYVSNSNIHNIYVVFWNFKVSVCRFIFSSMKQIREKFEAEGHDTVLTTEFRL